MFCDRCGTSLQNSPAFCPSCGKPVGRVPLMPVQSRIGGHVRLLGIFWLAYSAAWTMVSPRRFALAALHEVSPRLLDVVAATGAHEGGEARVRTSYRAAWP